MGDTLSGFQGFPGGKVCDGYRRAVDVLITELVIILMLCRDEEW